MKRYFKLESIKHAGKINRTGFHPVAHPTVVLFPSPDFHPHLTTASDAKQSGGGSGGGVTVWLHCVKFSHLDASNISIVMNKAPLFFSPPMTDCPLQCGRALFAVNGGRMDLLNSTDQMLQVQSTT